MTTPWPDPPQIPPTGPRTYSVPLKSCCGLMEGDWCDCAVWEAEVAAAFAGQSVMFDGKAWEVTR